MEPITVLISSALGYILKAAGTSEAFKTAENDLLTNFWKWIKPHFIHDVPELEKKTELPATVEKTEDRILELIKDEDFFKKLVQQVDILQKHGVKEKNIVRGDIERVKKIWIGNKEYAPGQGYDRENIVDGNVRDADEFRLGNG